MSTVSEIPGDAIINSAKLMVFCWEDDFDIGGGFHSRWEGRHTAYRAAAPWKGSSDWSGKWVSEGMNFDSRFADTLYYKGNPTGTWMEYDITEMVQFFVENPNENYGFVLSVSMDDPSEGHSNLGTDSVYQGYCFAGVNSYVDRTDRPADYSRQKRSEDPGGILVGVLPYSSPHGGTSRRDRVLSYWREMGLYQAKQPEGA